MWNIKTRAELLSRQSTSKTLRRCARVYVAATVLALYTVIAKNLDPYVAYEVKVIWWMIVSLCCVVTIALYYLAHCAQKREETEETEKMWLYFTYESQIKHVETTVHTRQEAADLLAQIEVYHAKHSISEEDYTRVRKQLLDFLADEDSCEE